MIDFKRIASFILSVVIALTSTVSVFAAANFDDDGNRNEENGLSDAEQDLVIEDSNPFHELDNPEDAYIEELEYDEYVRKREEYNETVKLLTALDIWEKISDGAYTELISAGEFFSIICRYAGFANYFTSDDDVSQKSKKAIEILRNFEYVDFDINPEDDIACKYAVRVIVNTFGYKTYAKMQGDSADAYMRVAIEQKILDKLSVAADEKLTRGMVADMLKDTLDAEVCVYNPNTTTERKAVLEYYKDICKITNTVKAVENQYTAGGDNRVRIGDRFFHTEQRDVGKFLECKVDAYYILNGEDADKLVYMNYYKNNTIKTIEGNSFKSYADRTISYYDENDKIRKLTHTSNAVTIMNDFNPCDLTEEDFKDCDYIRVVDNNNDERYDAVFVYKYDTMFVERIVPNANVIYGTYNETENGVLEVDFDSPYVEMYDRVGNPVENYYITKNSVLSVAKDANSSRMKIIVSNMFYQGYVKSVSTDSGYGGSTISFEDREYTYAPNYKYFMGDKAIRSGAQYTVYLDYKHRIAGYSKNVADTIKYGYMISAWTDPSTGEDKAVIKMLPYSGAMGTFLSADTIRIDGLSCDNVTRFFTALKNAVEYQRTTLDNLDESYIRPVGETGSAIYVRMPVMYKTNNKDEITYIDTPYHGVAEEISTNAFENKTMTMYDDFSKRTSTLRPGGMYLRNTLAFNSDSGHTVAVDTSTKVFVVPVSNDLSVINNSDNYQKTNLAYFDDWVYYPKTGTQYTVENRLEAYNVDKSRVAGVMVYYTSDAAPEIDKKVPLTVVTGISTAVNEDNETVTRLNGYQGNAPMHVDIADGVSLVKYYNGPSGEKITSTIGFGDIIRFVTNSKGELVDFVKVFSLKDSDDPNYVIKGNEYGTNVDLSTLNKTMLAVSDGKYASNGHNTPHVYDSAGSYNYGATYRLVYGTLLYKNGTNLVLETNTDTANGLLKSTEIADFSGFNVICIDEEAKKVYVPHDDEPISAQGGGADASKIILHTEGGKQRQMIIVRREKQ